MIDLARNETNKLRAYELTWSPATLPEKTDRFEFDSRLNGKRASLNRQVKSSLLNDEFADAILYLNDDFRPRIQDPVTNAIWKILGHDFGSGPSRSTPRAGRWTRLPWSCSDRSLG